MNYGIIGKSFFEHKLKICFKNIGGINMSINRKRLFIFLGIAMAAIACVVIVILLFTSSDAPEEPSLDEVLEEKLIAYETDLLDSLGSLDTNEDVANYLINWAKNKEIPATADENGNVIFTINPAGGYDEALPAAVVCSFDAKNMDCYAQQIAVAMCVAKNAQNHGKLSIIFLAETNGDNAGAASLDQGHFTDDTQVFYLGAAASSKISTTTGGYRHYTVSHKLRYQKPAYDTAFRIKIENCPVQLLNDSIDQTPNPIKTLGDVLANFKSTSLLFELSEISGGTDENLTAKEAEMTIVISDSDVEKFETKMDGFIEKFYDKYLEDYPDVTYTYEEVKLPAKVFNGEDIDNLVSFLYTAFDGVYYKNDDGNVVAITNIGKITSKNKKLKIDIAAASYSETHLEEISESYETICGLSDLTYKCEEEYPVFSSEITAADFLTVFEEAFKEFSGDSSINLEGTAEFTPCTILQQKNPSLPILYCAITEKTKHKFSGAIVTYLDQSTEEE